MKDNQDQVCERAEELISSLYGELGEQDTREFDRHLQECARCETELAGFGQIRASIVSWRDESLGVAWSRAAGTERELASTPVRTVTYARPSAFSAIREFFKLSPVWMKGAAVFASVLFCVSAIIAVAHFMEKPAPTATTPARESSEQLKARIAELQHEVAVVKAEQKEGPPAREELPSVTAPPKALKQNEFVASAGNTRVRNLRKPLTRLERQELAADLGLVASRDDDDLDLVTDTINQAP
jgi:anti-sigma factor RsiW